MLALQEYELAEGYVVCVVQLVAGAAFSLDKADCGLLALISVKNVVSRYWTARGATSSRFLAAHEKQAVKGFVLQQTCATGLQVAAVFGDKRVAKQFAVLAAKVARMEWPGDWADLLPTLFHALQQSASSNRLLLPVIAAVVHELSIKTIPAARRAFADAAVQMFSGLAEMWAAAVTQLLDALRRPGPAASAGLPSGAADILAADRALALTRLLDAVVRKALPALCGAPAFAAFVAQALQVAAATCAALKQGSDALATALGPALCDAVVADVATPSSSGSSSSSGGGGGGGGGSGEGMDEIDAEDILDSVRRALPADAFASLGLPVAVAVAGGFVAARLSALLVAAQKDHPLHTAAHLHRLLHHSHAHLVDHVATPPAPRPQQQLRALLTGPASVSAVLLLSNALACAAYSAEESVAKKKEKLQLRLQSAAGGGQGTTDSGDADVEQAAAGARAALEAFFDPARVSDLVLLLLRRALCHTESDLAAWTDTPEDFFAAQVRRPGTTPRASSRHANPPLRTPRTRPRRRASASKTR